MAKSERFNQMADDMAQRRERAMQRSADLQSEVNLTINKLKGVKLSDQDAQKLMERFGNIETLAAVSEDIIQDLIDGIQTFRAGRISKGETEESVLVASTGTAIDNLNRIVGIKYDETKEFNKQNKSAK